MAFLSHVDLLASVGEIGLQEGIIERGKVYYPYFEENTTSSVGEKV